MKRFKQYKQGIFHPHNVNKYIGTLPIVYRSSLELSFDRWCDRNYNVLQWGSESIKIPYVSPKDGKVHQYYTDAVVVLKTPEGSKKIIVEIKPSKQLQPPTQHGNKKMSTKIYEQVTYAVNMSKWEHARAWCKRNGYDFVILTEKDLR